MAEMACGHSINLGTVRLRAILDDQEPVQLGETHDGAHVGRPPGMMDDDDGARARR